MWSYFEPLSNISINVEYSICKIDTISENVKKSSFSVQILKNQGIEAFVER